MRVIAHSIIATLCILVLGTLGFAQQAVTETVGDGAIDWTNQTVRATGYAIESAVGGLPGKVRAAKLDALRKILETVKGARLNSETTVRNFMLESDQVTMRVEGMVQNFRMVGDPVYTAEGDLAVTIEMDMNGPGQLYDVVLQPQQRREPPRIVGTVSNSTVYTGLIIDARGLGLRPAIAPQVFNEDGDLVYGARQVEREWLLKYGMASYERSLSEARGNERIGDNPMVVSAGNVTGANRTDTVISNEDARTLLGVSENLTFLQDCRVIFLVD